jgi:hypothetical protein
VPLAEKRVFQLSVSLGVRRGDSLRRQVMIIQRQPETDRCCGAGARAKQRAGLTRPLLFEFGSECSWCGVAKRGVRPLGVVVVDPACEDRARLMDGEEQRLVK